MCRSRLGPAAAPDVDTPGDARMGHLCLVGRVGVPDDIAEMIVYLISQKSGFITGANFVIDGGMTRKMIYV